MPLAYSYRRFSTPEQALGDSQRRQEAKFVELVKRHQLTAAASYFDDGKSAWKGGKQRDLQKFLELVRAGEIPKGSWLIIESLDRISRQGFRPTQRVLEEIIEGGVIVATASPEKIFTLQSLDDPMAIIEILFIATRAKEESDRKSERVKEAWHAKLLKAKETGLIASAKGPGWLEFADGKWKVIPERVKVIKQIFKWSVVNGVGQRGIAKRLNTAGIPAFKGKQWGWAYVRLILTDRRVIGEFNSQVGVIPEYYPAIIDKTTFLKVQSATAKRQRFRGRTSEKIANLFSGLAFDQDTTSTMTYIKKGPTIPARWTPSYYEMNKNVPRAVTFPYEIFEQQFLRLTKELTISDVGVTSDKTTNKQKNEIESDLAKIELRLEELGAALSDYGSDPTLALRAIADLTARKHALNEQLNDLHDTTPSEALTQSQSLLEQLEQATGERLIEIRSQLRQSIRSLVNGITVKLTRNGWQTSLAASIEFNTGHKRRLLLVVERGELLLALADSEKWKSKPDKLTAKLSDKLTNYDEWVERAQKHKITIEL